MILDNEKFLNARLSAEAQLATEGGIGKFSE